MAIQISAPSSSSSSSKYRFDVFLSFRGEDTRQFFTVNLYYALRRKGINAFIDDKKLEKGERIAPALLKGIERSRISIIVFSKNYATSTWCLDELAHIIWCKEEKNQLVMPVFYKVDPMDVQYQRNSFGEAMAAHEDRFKDNMETVRKWKSALSKAASLSSAWLFEEGYEFGFIQRIVEDAYVMLPPTRLHSPEYLVGLDSRIEVVMSLLNEFDDRVCMLGIYGIGGIGKTTLAKAIYNSIFYLFDGACFLFDGREESKKYQGLVRLQQTLLSDILEEKKMKFGSAYGGISKIKHRLSCKKVLLVLDDVDDIEQLEQLAGGCDWFGCGSKIIITTRNKQLLIARNVERAYEMKELNKRDSLELLCGHAFRMSRPPKGYQDMCSRAISYAQGLPLALRVIGSNLGHKNFDEWRSTLEKYDQIPKRTIQEVLKISYDCLQDGAKRIFLDFACFFKEEILDYFHEIVEACDYGARFYIEVLLDKSLLIFNHNRHLCMHDLIKQMGREVIRKEARSNPGNRSRLWNYKDVLKVLHENSGSSKIEGILFDPPQQEEVKWNGLAFLNMINLRILIIRKARFSTGPNYLPNSLRWLEWEGYPSTKLPSNFSPNKLVFFKLCYSPFMLEEPLKRFECLTCMNFSDCEFIIQVPDISQCQSLKRLSFNDCHNLIKVHDSVGSHSKLAALNISGCINLTSFPRELKMPSLTDFMLSNCKSLDYFPHIVGEMRALRYVWADETSIKELPPSFGNLVGLESLNLRSCKNLRDLPDNLFTLKNLNWLDLDGVELDSGKSLKNVIMGSQPVNICTSMEFLMLENCSLLDEDIDLALNLFRNLVQLYLSGNDFVSLPECLKECGNLTTLVVNNCKRLRDIPELPSNMPVVEAENCTSLTTVSLGHLWSQAKKEIIDIKAIFPATKFPDWFHNWCEGGKISFLAHWNFPPVAIAFELGKANTSSKQFFHISLSINGRVLLNNGFGGMNNAQGHVVILNLGGCFSLEDWRWLHKFMVFYWNDVEIQVTCETPDIPVIKCGVYVYRQQINMENIQFKSPIMLSVNNAPRTSPEPRAKASRLNARPYKKFLRKLKVVDKGKLNKTKKSSRRNKRHQFFHSSYKRTRMVYPMGKLVWRFLNY